MIDQNGRLNIQGLLDKREVKLVKEKIISINEDFIHLEDALVLNVERL